MYRVQKLTDITKYKQLRYLLTGGLLFLIDYASSLAVYHAFDLQPGFASAVGFTTSFLVGFLMNKHIVFHHTKASRFTTRLQVTLYLLLAFLNLFIASGAVQLLVTLGMRIELAKPLQVAVMAIWNYFILNRFIFSERKEIIQSVQ